MSWQSEPLEFFCDGDNCSSSENFMLHVTFQEAHRKLRERGWQSYKRVGHHWQDYCPKCKSYAALAHERHKIAERERDRVRSRNA